MKFVLKRPYKFRQARAETGNANALDSLLPSILVIRRDGIDFFEEHLGRQESSVNGQFRATVTAQNAVANNRGGQGLSGDARQERWPMVGQERDGGQRGTQNDARTESQIFRERFVFTDDAKTAECGDDIHTAFARRLAHVRDERLIHFERNALFQLPAQHGDRFLRGARKLIEVLDEHANDRVGHQDRNVFVFCAQPGADTFESVFDGDNIN